MVTKQDFEGDVFAILEVLDSYGSKWFMDLGYTYYMCLRREWFNQIQEIDGGIVLMGNNKSCKI